MVPTESSRLIQQTDQYQSINGNHSKQKKLSETEGPSPCNADCCLICRQQLTKKYPLSSPAKNGVWCTGCARLLGPYKDNHNVRSQIIKELSILRRPNRRRRRARRKKKYVFEEDAKNTSDQSTPVPSMASTIRLPDIEQHIQTQDEDSDIEDQLPTSCFSSCFPLNLICWIQNHFSHKKQFIPMQETPYQYKRMEQPCSIQAGSGQPEHIKHQTFQIDLTQSVDNQNQLKKQPPVTKKETAQQLVQQQACQQKKTRKKKTKKKSQDTKAEAQQQQKTKQNPKQNPKQKSKPKEPKTLLTHLLKQKPMKAGKESDNTKECATQNYKELASRSHRTMCNRLKKLKKYGCQEIDIPSHEELVELMTQSRDICAISGIKGHWSSANFRSPFRLDFDHKIPVSMGGSFRVENLQITINCLNSVKGSESQDELKRWLKGFRKNKPKPSSSL